MYSTGCTVFLHYIYTATLILPDSTLYINESQLQEGYSLRLNTVGVVLEPPSVEVVVVAVTLLY